ncbi:MAG: carbohydrate porin [Casimicrobiaceae bacterium]
MTSHHRHWLAASAASAALFAACATTGWCQNALTDGVLGTQDVTGVGKIGRLHDNIRRAQQRESIYREISDLYADYTRWKVRVQNDTHVLFSIDVSVLQQWGFADGGSPALQLWAAPSMDWTAFKSKEWGTGSIQVAYNATTRYPTAQNAADIQSNLGLITPINDNSTRFMNVAQLTYTQATPDNRWLFTAGQYPLSNFDGNAYLGNQQQNFNNHLFAQDATQTYLDAGLGAYVQFNATSTFHLAAGFQGANNVLGQTISGNNFNRDCCAWFAYAQWAPSFPGLGPAQYSFSYFDTPSIPTQPASRGWSVNAVQNLSDTWAVFARANGAKGFVTPIETAYALGVAMNDPMKRASTDQIALAIGLSDAAGPPTNPPGARNEKVIEAYWTWTFFGGLLLTPSVQLIIDPALNPTKANVSVLSLRATFMF